MLYIFVQNYHRLKAPVVFKRPNILFMKNNQIRTLFSRKHDTVIPKLGVFLAGPTPPDGAMKNGWRRVIIDKLKADSRLDAGMVVVSPEPETGDWSTIDQTDTQDAVDVVQNKQIPWEWQYLNLCYITAFWLPTYWNESTAGEFAPNIGPTSRWEFGYFLQEYLKNPAQRHFIVGGPEDADSVKWAQRITALHGIKWHFLKTEDKSELVAGSFIQEIADTLVKNQWQF